MKMGWKNEENVDCISMLEDIKRLLKWKPMVVFLRFGAPLIGIAYLLYAAVLVRRGDMMLEVWFLP